MAAADTYNDIDLAWLMKLRTVVARLGEMDCVSARGLDADRRRGHYSHINKIKTLDYARDD